MKDRETKPQPARQSSQQQDLARIREDLHAHLRRQPTDTATLRRLAEVLEATDGAQEAARCLEHLGLVYAEQGRMADAESAFNDALKLWPQFGSAHHNLGNVYQMRGREAEAEASFRQALRFSPRALTCNSLGQLLESLGRLDAAADCYREATRLAPGDAVSHANLAAVLRTDGRFAEAASSYRQALKLDPLFEPALTGLAVLLDLEGKYQEGLALLREHATASTAAVPVILAYGRLLRHAGKPEEAIHLLNAQFERNPTERAHRRWLHFGLGDLYDDVGQYDEAFAHFAAANQLVAGSFDVEQCVSFVDRHEKMLPASAMQELPGAASRSVRPVFIVGMPRSGTTLVEQILSCHSRVYAAGERNDIVHAAGTWFGYRPDNTEYPASLLTSQVATLETIAEQYFSRLELPTSTCLLTDKFPANFRFLALIQLVFPNALVINCERQPLDCGLSIYTRELAGAEFAFASSLQHIGIYYRQYQRLMQHWRATLQLPIFDLQYEQLVERQEETTRVLLEFLGLEWEPACLEFHRQMRTVNTASHAQVRRPLYKSAIGRYRNYEQHLQPLMRELAEIA